MATPRLARLASGGPVLHLNAFRFRFVGQVGFAGLVQFRRNLFFLLVDHFLPALDQVASALLQFPRLFPSMLAPLFYLLR